MIQNLKEILNLISENEIEEGNPFRVRNLIKVTIIVKEHDQLIETYQEIQKNSDYNIIKISNMI